MKFELRHDEALETTHHSNKVLETTLFILGWVLLAAHLGLNLKPISLDQFPFERTTWTCGTLVLFHAMVVLGWRRALTLFAITALVSFSFEYAGVKTGLIFGRYEYTQALDPKLFGTVPLVIPMAYFMVIYPSGMLANLLLRGRVNARLGSPLWSLYAALLTALIMTSWDLVMDPPMVRVVKAWTWFDGGPYFGIPMQNFLGWVLTCFVCSAAYRLLEPRSPAHTYHPGTPNFLVLPILGYASLLFGTFLVGSPADTKAIAPFAMGIPLLGGLIRLYGR